MSTPFYKKARGHLSRKCPVMKRIIGMVGPCTLAPFPGDPFTLLVRCVIYQQISTKAAKSIYDKLSAAIGETPIPPKRLADMTEAEFKACGISGPKQRTLRAVIDHVRENPELLPNIENADDEAVHEQLTVIKGIGPWTADMFLIFGIMRPDVYPVGDYGVRVAIQKLYKLKKVPDAAKCLKIGEVWKPYRSVASWYLWRSLEPRYQQKSSAQEE